MILPSIPEEIKPKKKGKAVVYDCNKCGLSKKPLEIHGNQKSGLVFLGEAPGAEEMVQGIPFIGKSGQYLRSTVRRIGKISLEKDSAVINAVGCRPPGNKMSDTYLRCCRSKLIENLKQLKPKLIIALGDSAINSVMDLLGSKESIGKMRNRIIPCYEFDCIVYATFHPAGVLRKDFSTDSNLSYAFEKDIRKILDLWHSKLHSRPNVKLLLKDRDILKDSSINEIKTIKELRELRDKIQWYKKFSYDYETTNLKPFDNYFKVASVAFGLPDKTAYVIYLPHWKDSKLELEATINNLLSDPDILKIIQNAKYEELCTRYWIGDRTKVERSESGQVIQNTFDTMLATHVVDERRGCTSLDFQNLVRFGIKPYSSKVKQYLSMDKDEKQNKVFECNPQDLIEYTGLDVITTYANYEVLDGKLLNEGKFRWCYEFLLQGHEAFANMTEFGVPVNEDVLWELDELFNRKQGEIRNQIFDLPEVKSYLNPLQAESKTLKIKKQILQVKKELKRTITLRKE
jgi:uracil-DNA glycosylase